MLPYIEVPDLPVIHSGAFAQGWPAAEIALRPFGVLVVVAVAVGVWLTLRQARRLALPMKMTVEFIYFVVFGGFIGGHVFELVFYAPELVKADPLLLLSLAQGQSSFGGFLGATLGALLFGLRGRGALLPVAEVVASSFPVAWVIGRLGCAVAHDHPGIRSDLWFAVEYPAGGRLDLGLIEAVSVIPLALAFLYLRAKPRGAGFFVGWMCVYYAPLRFLLDALRATDLMASDRRYWGHTPAQWGAFCLLGVGVHFSLVARTRIQSGLHR
jgi:phosphatidylglycerol---prolipoprotein diacylglyceryl transferase